MHLDHVIIHSFVFGLWSCQNLATSLGIDLLSTGLYNLKVVCVKLFCSYFEGLMEDKL